MNMNRRDLAKAFGVAGASMFLPNLRSAQAAGTPPKRLLIFYTQHGTLPWLWKPQGSGTNFTLGPMLAPLEPYKKDLILIDGLDFKGLKGAGSKDDFTCGHARGQSSSLTASIQTEGATAKAGGPSIDYHIANGLIKENNGKPVTAVPVVQAAIIENRPNVMSWGQPYQPAAGQNVLPEHDALKVYNRLFPNGAPSSGDTAPMVDNKEGLQRKASLNFLSREYRLLQDKLGKFERDRLEQHANLVSDLQQRVDLVSAGGGPTVACKAPQGVKANKKQNAYYDPLIWENTRPTVPLLAQAAFACDLTRVFAIHVEDPPPRIYGGAPGFSSTHDMIHKVYVGPKTGPVETALKMYGVFTSIFKETLDLLASVKESDGKSLLYHTAVLWCGELAQPGHSTANCKWLTAGQLGGYLKTGQTLTYDDDRINFIDGSKGDAVPSNGDVFTTLANGMGVPTTAFGVNTKGELAAMKA